MSLVSTMRNIFVAFGQGLSLVAAIAAFAFCAGRATAAEPIATYDEGGRMLVAVEPLLRSLEIGYEIEGDALVADGRRYPERLIERDGMDLVDAATIARFLHLTVTRRAGTIVFSDPAAQAAAAAPPTSSQLSALRAELLAALNGHRAARGLPLLHVDPAAQRAAQFQADDMGAAAVLRHQDARGRSPMQRYYAMGGHEDRYAENVGWYQRAGGGNDALWNAISKLDAQMMAEQPPNDGHRVNILSPRYDGVGIGLANGPHGLYLAEDFSGP